MEVAPKGTVQYSQRFLDFYYNTMLKNKTIEGSIIDKEGDFLATFRINNTQIFMS